jgi:hypothetical protein
VFSRAPSLQDLEVAQGVRCDDTAADSPIEVRAALPCRKVALGSPGQVRDDLDRATDAVDDSVAGLEVAPSMIFDPVVVVDTTVDSSAFGRPRKSPPRSPSLNWRGSAVEPCATNL